MHRNHITTASIAAAILLSALSCIKERQPARDVAEGDSTPRFSVTLDNGKEFDSAVEKNCIISFFHTQCPDCQAELPVLQEIYNDYGTRVTIVTISREEEKESIARYWRENNLTMPFCAQKTREIYSMFSTTGIPKTYIIKDGKVKRIWGDNPIATYSEIEEQIIKHF